MDEREAILAVVNRVVLGTYPSVAGGPPATLTPEP